MRWRGNREHWGVIAIAFHWLTTLVVIEQFVLGLWMTELSYYDRWYHDAPSIHKSIGSLLFFALFARLGWRRYSRRPEELPEHQPWERMVAKITHITLYLLLFAVTVSGYLISTADGRGIEIFDWFTLPATLQGLENQEDIAGVVHLFLATLLIALALLHAAAALKHHFFDRDRTLIRMLRS